MSDHFRLPRVRAHKKSCGRSCTREKTSIFSLLPGAAEQILSWGGPRKYVGNII